MIYGSLFFIWIYSSTVGASETVKFNINGVNYERTTNESGIAKLNINFDAWDYRLRLIFSTFIFNLFYPMIFLLCEYISVELLLI